MRVNNILVATDFSEGSREAVRYAHDLARTLGATLHVTHVLENPFAPGAFMGMYALPAPDYFVDLERQAQARLEASLSAADKQLVPIVMTVRTGVPADEILARAGETPKIDLILMSTHGRGGVARLVMGSVADKVLRGAPCPVLTMRVHPETFVTEPVPALQEPAAV
jgi:nucleotide-binding universal stress UspA family protein